MTVGNIRSAKEYTTLKSRLHFLASANASQPKVAINCCIMGENVLLFDSGPARLSPLAADSDRSAARTGGGSGTRTGYHATVTAEPVVFAAPVGLATACWARGGGWRVAVLRRSLRRGWVSCRGGVARDGRAVLGAGALAWPGIQAGGAGGC